MTDKKIIFFDGVCNLCNGFIDYVINRNKNNSIYYAALQSDIAIEKLKEYDNIVLESNYNTIYYYTGNKVYSKSSAVLRIFLELSVFHKVAAKILLLIPKFIRDACYNLVAKNRYRFLGKKETCRLPTENERKQFL
ncbi:thiol-disulfide oxidoreductase DCC family protein [Flavivirga sp. 57AJ16]|uniref:thiol-disulfide oxidoreductase DCC family protein n=1 Tax=Flavivirga sp. 57AJ16 TaxID=3025307 RepID=UPI002366886C|nr:DCC1-like thiol-disulfide oxidoreductase family protein [Flavivirga sp. 57AJ16]MDD7885828.1 DCC1-like thiol-disulfide oxidoreductase family protein [Flavivirga sp. 57AJ16]